MCSIVMPGDYEMLVSHSPPLFGHSYLSRRENIPRTTARTYNQVQQPIAVTASPKRPCLVMRSDDSSSGDEEIVTPTRLKKKVVFADDRGMSLTHVRVMTEPSNVPPVWSFRFFAHLKQNQNERECMNLEEPWEVMFSQPASDYVAFRKQLDTNKVSLENVIIKETENMVVGTIKVSNIAFEKEVILRASSDNWETHEDIPCNFITNSSNSAVYVLYDTFSFKITLPEKRHLEFCVCFRCDGNEFWDNNNTLNYKLSKRITSQKEINPRNVTLTIKSSDIYHTKIDSWSEFASWTNLENNAPFW